MKLILHVFSWRRVLTLSIGVLILLCIFNFYGLYTNQFYFLKPDNYIFPLLTMVHFTFLYVLWFKIRENELSDPQMRNLEYVLYFIFLVYIYKFFEAIQILMTYNDYENHVIPSSFLPLGILIMVLLFFLLGLTLLAIKYRKDLVGDYKFDDMGQHIDSWE